MFHFRYFGLLWVKYETRASVGSNIMKNSENFRTPLSVVENLFQGTRKKIASMKRRRAPFATYKS